LLSISDNSPSFLIRGVSFVVAKHNEMFTTTFLLETSDEVVLRRTIGHKKDEYLGEIFLRKVRKLMGL